MISKSRPSCADCGSLTNGGRCHICTFKNKGYTSDVSSSRGRGDCGCERPEPPCEEKPPCSFPREPCRKRHVAFGYNYGVSGTNPGGVQPLLPYVPFPVALSGSPPSVKVAPVANVPISMPLTLVSDVANNVSSSLQSDFIPTGNTTTAVFQAPQDGWYKLGLSFSATNGAVPSGATIDNQATFTIVRATQTIFNDIATIPMDITENVLNYSDDRIVKLKKGDQWSYEFVLYATPSSVVGWTASKYAASGELLQ